MKKTKISSPLKIPPPIQEVIFEETDSTQAKTKEFFKEFHNKNKLKLENPVASKEYFCCDSTNHRLNNKTKDTIHFSQIWENDTSFNKIYFFEFLFYQIMFFFCLGPFLSVFLYFLNKNSVLARNQNFWGLNKFVFIQTFQYVITVTSFCLYYNFHPKLIYLVEIYMLVIHLIMNFCIKSIKYATINDTKMEYFKNKRLTHLEFASEFFMGIFERLERFELEKELQATILRKEIDIGLFCFKFIAPINPNYDIILRDEMEQVEGGDVAALKETEIGMQAEKLRKKVKTCLGGQVYSGFNLAGLILKQNQEYLFAPKQIHYISIFLGLISAVIPNIVRFVKNGTCFGENKAENYMIISLFFGTLLFVKANCIYLINSLFEYDQVYQYLSQMSNLLSSRRLNYYYSRKYLPTIDFFEPFTFKSWGTLHRVLRNYGKKQKIRVDYQLTIFLLGAIIFIIGLALSVFDYLGSFSIVNIAVFVYHTFVILVIILLILKKGLAINKLYALHITILKNNKNILSDLLRLNEIYFHEKFISENEIYSQGIFMLRNLSESMLEQNYHVKQSHVEEDKQLIIIKKILKNLIKISDDLTEELRFTLENEPFNVLSIPATEDFVHSVAMLIASGVVAILKKIIVN